MRKMQYKAESSRELLYFGIYKGYRYFVMSYGTHPCGYIQLNDEELPNLYENDDFVSCHGGLTYASNHLRIDEKIDLQGKFIGWDYNHFGDFNGYALIEKFGTLGGIRYTTEEIKEECKEVINQLKMM